MKSGIWMMMCYCTLSPLLHGDDMLVIVSTCLLHSLSVLAQSLWNRLQNSTPRGIKTSSRVAGPCPMQSLCGQWWKNNSTYENHRGFAVVPPVDRNLRRRQECVRAWSWLSSKQILMRRQVCSACPHSCSCLQLFSLLSAAAFST